MTQDVGIYKRIIRPTCAMQEGISPIIIFLFLAGPADLSGMIKVEDELLAVNRMRVWGMTHEQVCCNLLAAS